MRIPWEKVAEMMGPKFTDGAIVQHLAKLRQKMVANNMAVPPPLKRGIVNTPSKLYAPASRRTISLPGSSGTPNASNSVVVRPKKAKNKRLNSEEEDESLSDLVLSDDSDGEYGSSKKKGRTSGRKNKAKKQKVAIDDDDEAAITNPKIEMPSSKAGSVGEEGDIKESIETPGPAARTRGVVQDYAKMEEGEGDEFDEDDNEEPEEEPEEEDEKDFMKTELTAEEEISPRTQVAPFAATQASLFVRLLVYILPSMLADNPKGTPISQSPSNSGFAGNFMMPSYTTGQPTFYPQTYQVPLNGGLFYPKSHPSSFSTERTGSMNSVISPVDPSQLSFAGFHGGLNGGINGGIHGGINGGFSSDFAGGLNNVNTSLPLSTNLSGYWPQNDFGDTDMEGFGTNFNDRFAPFPDDGDNEDHEI